MTKCFFAIINTICLIFIILLTSIELPTFNYAFYNYEYNKNETYDQIGINSYDLEKVTNKLTGYMRGTEENLEVYVNINGGIREFFNNLEKSHMVDVKNLFQIGFAVRNIAIVIFIITTIIAFVYKRRPALKEYALSYIIGNVLFLLSCGALTGVILSDFNKYFTIFHEIFFDNDLWILDPSTDLLINIVPLGFFIDIFTAVVAIFFLISIIFTIISIAYLKSGNKEAGGAH
ncbi:TIGR01906 family membrane protein [Tyzzerella sp. OttesenSCG-928-J15]|nr:TIGR01906 family membrane protein [Tyzzerella sp. OttesenSCG-928-J15]